MANKNMSLDALKSHLFETLEGVKNLSDPEASENEKISIEQAKQIVSIAESITDIYKLQVDALEKFARMDNVANPGRIMADMGVANDDQVKMLGQ